MRVLMIFTAWVALTVITMGDTIIVPDDYSSIQEAIDAADSGDTILIVRELNYESIVIDKALTIKGAAGWRYASIDGGGGPYVVRMTTEGVKLVHLKISNALFGIELADSDTLSDLQVLDCDWGVLLSGVSNHISRCDFQRNEYGLWIGETYGDSLKRPLIPSPVLENEILDNIFSYNETAIMMYGAFAPIRHNLFKKNSIGVNTRGMVIEFDVDSNTIIENTIAHISVRAMQIGPDASSNWIYHNDFLIFNDVFDEGSNVWDNGYPDGGNYWDDYTGEDGDGDLIGDDPYPIPGGDNIDNYPLFIRHNYRCGDANGSWLVDIDDVVYLICYIFMGGGDLPYPGTCIGDTDGSGGVDIDDVVHLMYYIFQSGPAPAADCCESW